MEYQINKFITLKLENDRTNIYVKNKLFDHCKCLLIDIPVDDFEKFDDVESTDEAIDLVDESPSHYEYKIPPELEFFGHFAAVILHFVIKKPINTRLLAVWTGFLVLSFITVILQMEVFLLSELWIPFIPVGIYFIFALYFTLTYKTYRDE